MRSGLYAAFAGASGGVEEPQLGHYERRASAAASQLAVCVELTTGV